MSSAVIVATSNPSIPQSATSLTDFAVLGYHNILQQTTITGHGEDSIYPFSNVLDYKDVTKYSPSQSNGTTVIEFNQSTSTTIDYFSFAVHNGGDCGLNGKLEVHNGAEFVQVAQFASLKTDRPFLKHFSAISSRRQRLTFSYGSKVFIGAIHIGKATIIKCPSIGFQTGRYASLDVVEQFKTEGNNFKMGRRRDRGFQMRGDFRLMRYSDIEQWYEIFMNHVLDSKPLFFKWSQIKDETVYGQQNVNNLPKLKYVTTYNTDISLEINGYA